MISLNFMELFSDVRLWFLIVLAWIWVERNRQAVQTLETVPFIHPEHRYPAKQPDLVSVILPAKNEEDNIAACLDSLLHQDYPNYEILAANDSSTDRTAQILENYAGRLRVVNVPETPDGWTGKNFAIHTAIEHARGRWLLFTDADTRHEPSSLSAGLSHARAQDLALLTLTPRCLARGFWENMLQPCIMSFIGLWFPFKKINDPRSSVYFANGQYILMTAALYKQIEGHASVREEFLEDFALMKKTKELGLRAECAIGVSIFGTRMYSSIQGMWKGWRRIYLHAFKSRAEVLAAKMLNVLFSCVLPFVILGRLTYEAFRYRENFALLWGAALGLTGFILLTMTIAYSTLKAKRRFSLLFPFAAVFLALILGDAARMAATGAKTKWR